NVHGLLELVETERTAVAGRLELIELLHDRGSTLVDDRSGDVVRGGRLGETGGRRDVALGGRRPGNLWHARQPEVVGLAELVGGRAVRFAQRRQIGGDAVGDGERRDQIVEGRIGEAVHLCVDTIAGVDGQ